MLWLWEYNGYVFALSVNFIINTAIPLFGPIFNVILFALMMYMDFDEQIQSIKKIINDYNELQNQTIVLMSEWNSCFWLGKKLSGIFFDVDCTKFEF